MEENTIPMNGAVEEKDEELVAAAQAGDADAFGRLHRKYGPPLFHMLFRHLGHREETEDMVQQVFVQAFNHLKGFRGQAKFYTWLYTIALNRVRNHIRQKKNLRMISLDAPAGPMEDAPPTQWAEKAPSPEEEALRRAQVEHLERSVDKLGEDQRAIFILHYFQHLSLDEVATRLNRPLGTVKVYLHRARKAVYKSINERKRKEERTR